MTSSHFHPGDSLGFWRCFIKPRRLEGKILGSLPCEIPRSNRLLHPRSMHWPHKTRAQISLRSAWHRYTKDVTSGGRIRGNLRIYGPMGNSQVDPPFLEVESINTESPWIWQNKEVPLNCCLEIPFRKWWWKNHLPKDWNLSKIGDKLKFFKKCQESKKDIPFQVLHWCLSCNFKKLHIAPFPG